jgi:hypothetical protein
MPLEPRKAWNNALTNEDENVEIASQESGGCEVAFDENAESCKMSATLSNNSLTGRLETHQRRIQSGTP